MKVTNQFLAILVVAMCLLTSGCALFAGPQNCEFGSVGFACNPNPDAGGDGVSYSADGTVMSPETNNNPDTAKETASQVCAPYVYLKGSEWLCHIGGLDRYCVLDVIVHTDGECWVICPVKEWGVKANTIKFPSAGKLEYQISVNNPHICDYKAH